MVEAYNPSDRESLLKRKAELEAEIAAAPGYAQSYREDLLKNPNISPLKRKKILSTARRIEEAEGAKANLERVNIRLRAFEAAERKGTTQAAELKRLKQKEAARDYARLSPAERQAYDASRQPLTPGQLRDMRIEREKRQFEIRQGRLSEGVQSSLAGQQLIVLEGRRAETAGELVTRLKGKKFEPVQQRDPALLKGPQTGISMGNASYEPNFSAVGGQPGYAGYTLTRTVVPAARGETINDEQSFKIFYWDTGLKYTPRTSAYYEERARNVGVPYKSAGFKVVAFATGTFEGLTYPILQTENFVYGTKQLFTNPKQVFRDTVQSFRENPVSTSGQFYGGYYFFKGTFKAVGTTFRAAEAGATRLSPNYIGTVAEKGTMVIRDVPTSKGPVTLQVVRNIGSESLPKETLRVQALRAGTEVNAVSGARGFFSPTRRTVTIDKPLPTPDANPIERSFFYDPEARLRPTRLGLTEGTTSASLSDVATGNFRLFPERPQAILTPAARVESFPSSLSGVRTKLLANRALSSSEEAALLEFQLKPSGQLKPVGFLSGEPEVTLAPGEALRRVPRQGAVTLLPERGKIIPRRVPIYEAEIVQVGENVQKTARTPGTVGGQFINIEFASGDAISIPRGGVLPEGIGSRAYPRRSLGAVSRPYLSPARPGSRFASVSVVYGGSSGIRAAPSYSYGFSQAYGYPSFAYGGSSLIGGSSFIGGSSPVGGSSPTGGSSPGGSPFRGGGSPFGGSGTPRYGGASPGSPPPSVSSPFVPSKKKDTMSSDFELFDVKFSASYNPSIQGGLYRVRGTRQQARIASYTGVGVRPLRFTR